MNRPALASVAGLVLLLPLAACSSDAPPAETVPDLATQLEQIDAAIADGDYARARTAVDALVARTAQAEVADEITDDEADRILDAAREVLAELPAPDEPAPTSPAPTESSAPPVEQPVEPPAEDLGEDDGGDDEDDGEEKPGKGNGEKEDKGKKDD